MPTRQRLGEINRAVLTALADGGPMSKADVLGVRQLVPPTPDEGPARAAPSDRRRAGRAEVTDPAGAWLTCPT